jgi:hypothetical protein
MAFWARGFPYIGLKLLPTLDAFQEIVSVSSPFFWRCLQSISEFEEVSLCDLRKLLFPEMRQIDRNELEDIFLPGPFLSVEVNQLFDARLLLPLQYFIIATFNVSFSF